MNLGVFKRRIDVDAEIQMTPLKSLYASGDKDAHVFELSLYRGTEEMDLSGASAQGYFIRADGYTVPITGAISGNVVTLTLSESCYYVVGNFNLIIKVSIGESRKSVFWGNGYVVRSMTGAIVDEENVIPSLDELLAQIAATEAAAKAANQAASAANSAATSARKAASAADTNASSANSAANAATAAAAKIDGMTITATGLAAGAAPTATLTEVAGHYNIVLGLPKGDKGEPGATPQITVQVKTGEPGTAASVKQTGTAEAPVIELTIPRGDTGSLGNLTINGKAPDAAGKVTLTAADVGAASAAELSQLKTDIAPLLYNNAGAHNAVYRGKNLGTSVTAEQWAAIADGTFTDIYIGDYWEIGGVIYRIAAFDYYYKTGDTPCNTHHVTLVPDGTMYHHAMNDTNVTTGGYVGSKMYTTGLDNTKTTINNAFGSAHILTHRQLLCNAVSNGKPSGGSWYDSTVELMTEQNMYGGKMLGAGNDGSAVPELYTVDKSQYPLFAFRPDLISNRNWFWLRDVVSAAHFASVSDDGSASCNSASATSGVRPAFSIIG